MFGSISIVNSVLISFAEGETLCIVAGIAFIYGEVDFMQVTSIPG